MVIITIGKFYQGLSIFREKIKQYYEKDYYYGKEERSMIIGTLFAIASMVLPVVQTAAPIVATIEAVKTIVEVIG